ncbi:hypothetical protein NM688_g7669 [Phlebia brevispora]|uniref:Uncharacterized protein n=1 Tax=Phlebia brevispora TaxID=194682 RepID=A0ACC1S2H5_9APHY|nr:hypothetical protein NM688_g7669 [Phlebia brevispora]
MEPACEEPSRKRAKTVDNSQYERDPTHWFSTGDIIFVCSHKSAYRVHSDVLGQKSSVFHDLLDRNIPPPADQETLDGCPVVHVEDKPEDFGVFLGLIYNPWRFLTGDQPPGWPLIRVMLVLGDKYDVVDFHDEGVKRLQQAFPRDVSQWVPNAGFVCRDVDCTSIANVTRNLGMPDLHATVLYQCCALPIATLLRGVGGEGEDDMLCADDLRRCLHGREHMAGHWLKQHLDLFSVAPPPETNCLCRPNCSEHLGTIRVLAQDHALDGVMFLEPGWTYDPICGSVWEDLMKTLEQNGMCLPCREFYQTRLLGIRQEFRNSLEELFSLPQENNENT